MCYTYISVEGSVIGMEQTYYDILDLPKYGRNEYTDIPISFYEIRAARDRLIYGNNGEDSLPYYMQHKVEEAYRVLSDVETRREYDKKLEAERLQNSFEPSEEIIEQEELEEIQEIIEQEDELEEEKNDEIINQDIPVVEEIELDIDEQFDSGEMELGVVEEPDEEEIEQEVVEGQDQEEVEQDIVENQPEEKIEEPVVEDEPEEKEQDIVEEQIEEEIVPEQKESIFPKIVRNFELIPKTTITNFDDVSTEETRLMEEYEEKLINEIYDLLNKSYSNYELEIANLKYKNQIELLKKRIEFKQNQKIASTQYVNYCLSLLALKLRLKNAEKRLQKLEEYINNYNQKNEYQNDQEIKKHGLAKINDKLENTEEKLNNKEKYNMFYIKYLEVKKSKLLEKRESKINKMALHRNGIVRNTRIVIAYDITKTKVQDFIEKFKEEQIEDIRTR